MADKLTEKSIAALAAKVVAEEGSSSGESAQAWFRTLRCSSVPPASTLGGSHTDPRLRRARSGTKTIVLGSWPSISADEARRLGKAQIGQIVTGADPAAERRQRRAVQRPTVAQALDRYGYRTRLAGR